MIKKKSILIFLNTYTKDSKGMSGGFQMLVQIFKRIRPHFNKVYIYTSKAGAEKVKIELRNVDFLLSSTLVDTLNIFIKFGIKTIEGLSCLKLKNIDIIYSSSDFLPDVFPAFLYKLFHKKTKWFQCVFHIYPSWKNRAGNKVVNFIAQLLQQLSLLLIKKADTILNINSEVRNYLINKGFEPNKIVINTPGIDYELLSNLKSNRNINKYDAVFLARLHPSKGIFDLIKIWSRVVAIKPSSKLAIVGHGTKEITSQLIKEISSKKLQNNISVLGYLNNNELFPLIKSSRMFIFPSHEEGFGIAIAEAMASKIPVITWNLPVYNEHFSNYLFQIKENDYNLFSQKIIELLNNEELSKRIVNNAFEFVKKYDWEKISQKHFNILNT